MTNRPELYQYRLLQKSGKTELAYDFARSKGTPVAVVGSTAVECIGCGAKIGVPCRGDKRSNSHFERIIAMNKKIKELSDDA